MEDGDYNYQEALRKMLHRKENHRTYEAIIHDLQKELQPVKEESLLIHAMRLFIELEHKTISPLYTHLQSPMRQTLYMIDVYYSIVNREETVDMDEERWNRIAILLDEMAMTYLVNIGFPNNGDFYNDERDATIDVTLCTFIGYFENAVLSYEEQTLDRINRYLKPYDELIRKKYGFTIDEAIRFVLHVRDINNAKYSIIMRPYVETLSYYATRPEEWRKLTSEFMKRGVTAPRDWWYEPELSGMLKTMTTNPGEISLHTVDVLEDVEIDSDSLKHIVDFYSYDKELLKGKTIYYADKHYSESHPIFKLGDKYVCLINKFFIEGLYYGINEVLLKDDTVGQKYKQNKDDAFEEKVREVFELFFPKGTKIFANYSVDGESENDLLVVFGDTCIVVEIKNCGFRAPFRDPIKAFPRIKRDYENAVQLGYDQCRRVENVLLSGKDVDILDASNMHKVLYRLKSKNIGDVWSIVVTDFKYGVIQTNLGPLLKKDEEALYPWSVCVDDLESMMLLMKKILKGIAPARFVEFLDYRERLQGHIMCFDELEICGWYMNDREQFKKYADNDAMINTSPNMGTIFDAYYHTGLGFKNELDIDYKRGRMLDDYPKKFELGEFIGKDVVEGVTNKYV